jgi:HSP20 family protein
MALIRWDPAGELVAIRNQMDRLLEERFPQHGPGRQRGREEWTPAVDIFEKQGGIVLRVEIPGVEIDDVSVEVKGDMLIIQGQRRLDETIRWEAYRRIERPYGSFRRSFALPQGVDQGNIRARLNNGVLEVTLPLSDERPPKAGNVKVE